MIQYTFLCSLTTKHKGTSFVTILFSGNNSLAPMSFIDKLSIYLYIFREILCEGNLQKWEPDKCSGERSMSENDLLLQSCEKVPKMLPPKLPASSWFTGRLIPPTTPELLEPPWFLDPRCREHCPGHPPQWVFSRCEDAPSGRGQFCHSYVCPHSCSPEICIYTTGLHYPAFSMLSHPALGYLLGQC